MTRFNQKQIEQLRGSISKIAVKVGCTREYVSKVVNGRVLSETETTQKIEKTASLILEILEPETV